MARPEEVCSELMETLGQQRLIITHPLVALQPRAGGLPHPCRPPKLRPRSRADPLAVVSHRRK